MGAAVGTSVGVAVGVAVGPSVGALVGALVGAAVGEAVGKGVGAGDAQFIFGPDVTQCVASVQFAWPCWQGIHIPPTHLANVAVWQAPSQLLTVPYIPLGSMTHVGPFGPTQLQV